MFVWVYVCALMLWRSTIFQFYRKFPLSTFIQGIRLLVHWLSYIPERKDAPPPVCRLIFNDRGVLQPPDPIDREVAFVPTRSPYDPRWMLNGIHLCACVRACVCVRLVSDNLF